MKKLISLLFLFNQIAYSTPFEEAKETYEYLLAKSFWGLLITCNGVILLLLIVYYMLLLFSVNLKSRELYSIMSTNIFENSINNKNKLSEEIYIKAMKTVFLFAIWLLSIMLSQALEAFPLFSILIFILSIKPFFIVIFPNLERKTIEKFLLGFFAVLFILSLGNSSIASDIMQILK